MADTDVFALISSDGRLELREGVVTRMDQDTDPEQWAAAGFLIHRATWGTPGLEGRIGRGSLLSGSYPPNRTATMLVAVLGGPEKYVFGNLAICGVRATSNSRDPTLCGLTAAQQDLIRDVHTAVQNGIGGTR
ncbi:hypothetical protein [Streptomyces sp. TR02-1]|uniref:hypothetical protein n=1 Tax=Streptomyces sp. TR02-1 TaxID=3385977 RepID=UPI0039A306D2